MFDKNSASERNESLLSNCRAQPVLFKNSASERNESLLSNCRAQPVLFKNSASERNESLLSNCRAQPVLFKNQKSLRLAPKSCRLTSLTRSRYLLLRSPDRWDQNFPPGFPVRLQCLPRHRLPECPRYRLSGFPVPNRQEWQAYLPLPTL